MRKPSATPQERREPLPEEIPLDLRSHPEAPGVVRVSSEKRHVDLEAEGEARRELVTEEQDTTATEGVRATRALDGKVPPGGDACVPAARGGECRLCLGGSSRGTSQE